MADLREKVEAELANINDVLRRLPPSQQCSTLSELELAGVATLLLGLYNGIENVLKQVAVSQSVELLSGPSWHRDLIEAMVEQGTLQAETASHLRRYLAFRHFISHAYGIDLHADRIQPLVADAEQVAAAVRADVARAVADQ